MSVLSAEGEIDYRLRGIACQADMPRTLFQLTIPLTASLAYAESCAFAL